MFSIKKIIKSVIMGILGFILLALVINFFFLPGTKSSISRISEEIHDVKTRVVAMDLPVRVLDNIISQVKEDPDKVTNDNLSEAYESNLAKLKSLNEENQRELPLLEKELKKLNSYSISFYQTTIKELNENITEIKNWSNELENVLLEGKITNLKTEAIKTYNSYLYSYADTLELEHQVLNDDILSTYTFVVNFIFVVLIVMLVLLILVIYKSVIYDQQFVLESFKNIEYKHFEFDKLPKTKPFFEEDYIIHDRVKIIFEEEQFVQKIKAVVSNTYHIDDLMQQLFKAVSFNKKVDRIGIAFVDYSRKKFIAEYGIASYGDIKLGPGFEVDFDKTSLTSILNTKSAFITKDLEKQFKQRPNSASLKILLKEGVQSNMVVPLQMGEAVFGVIFFSALTKDYFNADDLRRAEKMIYEISGLLNKAYFTKVILSKVTNSFAELVDQKDNETGGHILRMVAYSTLIARRLMAKKIKGYEVDEKFILEIERNASSHDIGKVGIPDKILKKPGKLTPDEWIIMKTHAAAGADIFKSLREGLQVFGSDFYEYAEVIARYHHERWDGSGYPEGLVGDTIPLPARIVAVADVFDALMSKRHYKEPFGLEKSIEIIKESTGTHLDAVIVDVFLEEIDEIIAIQTRYEVD